MLTETVLKSNAVTKRRLVEFFVECDISMNFPLLQRRMFDQDWTYKQATVLKKAGLWIEPPAVEFEKQIDRLYSVLRNRGKSRLAKKTIHVQIPQI